MGIEISKDTLSKVGASPKRDFETIQDFKTYFEDHKTLILSDRRSGCNRTTGTKT